MHSHLFPPHWHDAFLAKRDGEDKSAKETKYSHAPGCGPASAGRHAAKGRFSKHHPFRRRGVEGETTSAMKKTGRRSTPPAAHAVVCLYNFLPMHASRCRSTAVARRVANGWAKTSITSNGGGVKCINRTSGSRLCDKISPPPAFQHTEWSAEYTAGRAQREF